MLEAVAVHRNTHTHRQPRHVLRQNVHFWGGAPQGVVPLTFVPLAESPR